MEVLVITVALIWLIAIAMKASNKLEPFAETQKNIINTLNEKDSIYFYLDTSVELASKMTRQSTLAKNGGYSIKKVDSSLDQPISPCGDHVYPLLSDLSGNICVPDINKEYSEEFGYHLNSYLSDSRRLSGKDFNVQIIDGDLVGVVENSKIELTIMKDSSLEDANIIPRGDIMNPNILKGEKADIIAEEIRNLDPHNVDSGGGCAGFISNLLSKIGNSNVPCITGDAWDIAACYLLNHKSRIVYAGQGLSYEDMIEEEVLKQGDLLFLSTKDTWCKWSGLNAEEFTGDFDDDELLIGALSQCGGDDGRPALRKNPRQAFCAPGTIENMDYPLYCNFKEGDNNPMYEYEDFIIVTHIVMYVDKNHHTIAHKRGKPKYVDASLEQFLKNNKARTDGIRIIVRPEYT